MCFPDNNMSGESVTVQENSLKIRVNAKSEQGVYS